MVIRRAWVLLVMLGLGACGFQLRGNAALPFESVYIEGGQDIVVDLERAIRPTATKVTTRAQDAQVILQILGESREKRILSLNSAGRVSEFTLLYRVNFKVSDKRGRELLSPQQIELRRDITFNDSEILAKESEEALLYHDMQTDAVQQIIRRLGAVHLNP
ncbi:MAG: LPS-assembly lipoprotein LptE [Burkholderiales bacterium]